MRSLPKKHLTVSAVVLAAALALGGAARPMRLPARGAQPAESKPGAATALDRHATKSASSPALVAPRSRKLLTGGAAKPRTDGGNSVGRSMPAVTGRTRSRPERPAGATRAAN